jgi:GNAT superfamily N-acetyltransferase
LAVFNTNVPLYFREEERAEYAAFLDALPGPYFVIVGADEGVVGCGGYAIREDSDLADLCWGMVRQDRQGEGLGRALAEARLERIWRDPRVRAVALSTTQHTVGFYERLGFRTTSVSTDGYGPGLDRVAMLLEPGG